MFKRFLRKSFFAVLVGLSAVCASAQNVINLPISLGGVDDVGSRGNVTSIHWVTGKPFRMAPTITLGVGGLLRESAGHLSTRAHDLRVRITRYYDRSKYTDFALSDVGDFVGTIPLVNNQVRHFTSDTGFVGQILNPGDMLRLELYEAVQDGTDLDIESFFLGTPSFTFGTHPGTPAVFRNFEVVNEDGDSKFTLVPGETKWFKFKLIAPANIFNKLRITTGETRAFGEKNDTEIALFSPDGFLIDSDDDSGPGYTSSLDYGFVPSSVLPAGTYYVAVTGGDTRFDNVFTSESNSHDSGKVSLTFSVTRNQIPEISHEFGDLVRSDTVIKSYAPGQVRWFRFTLPRPIRIQDRLDIHTRYTYAYHNTRVNDTEIALFDSLGNLIRSNEDILAEGSWRSAMKWTGLGNELPGGTYYVAVGGQDLSFGSPWQVTSHSQGSGPIELTLDFFRSVSNSNNVVSGNVKLSEISGSVPFSSMSWEIRDLRGQTVDQGGVSVASSGNFNFYTGRYGPFFTVWLKCPGGLGKSTFGVNFLTSAVVNITLVNGDIDNDNEIGSGDLSILMAYYGTQMGGPNFRAEADLNKDGQVGQADLTIISRNFGMSGD